MSTSGSGGDGTHGSNVTELRGRTIGDQIRRRAGTFAAIIVLLTISLLVLGYVMSNERLTLPSWVPIFGKSFYTIKGEFQTAQAVTPGQGQAVTVAGVKVGEISSVSLENGRALVTMNVQPRFAPVYADATMLLRPKTQLKDMTVELNKGRPASGALRSGSTLPISQTAPDINLDEVLSALDADTRSYLQLLLNGGGTALRGQGVVLSSGLRRFAPTARDLAKIGSLLVLRQADVAHVIHNLALLTSTISTRDRQLSGLVDSSNAVFDTFARENARVSSTISLLPAALNEARGSLGRAATAANALNAALTGLLPTAKALGPVSVASQSFFRATTPVIANQIRPFTVAALPIAKSLAPATADLAVSSPNLTTAFGVLSTLLNELAYNPGQGKASFLFFLSWANHNLNSLLSSADAHGPMRQGLLLFTCAALQTLQIAASANPNVELLLGLLNPPDTTSICAGSSLLGRAGAGRSQLRRASNVPSGLNWALQGPGSSLAGSPLSPSFLPATGGLARTLGATGPTGASGVSGPSGAAGATGAAGSSSSRPGGGSVSPAFSASSASTSQARGN